MGFGTTTITFTSSAPKRSQRVGMREGSVDPDLRFLTASSFPTLVVQCSFYISTFDSFSSIAVLQNQPITTHFALIFNKPQFHDNVPSPSPSIPNLASLVLGAPQSLLPNCCELSSLLAFYIPVWDNP